MISAHVTRLLQSPRKVERYGRIHLTRVNIFQKPVQVFRGFSTSRIGRSDLSPEEETALRSRIQKMMQEMASETQQPKEEKKLDVPMLRIALAAQRVKDIEEQELRNVRSRDKEDQRNLAEFQIEHEKWKNEKPEAVLALRKKYKADMQRIISNIPLRKHLEVDEMVVEHTPTLSRQFYQKNATLEERIQLEKDLTPKSQEDAEDKLADDELNAAELEEEMADYELDKEMADDKSDDEPGEGDEKRKVEEKKRREEAHTNGAAQPAETEDAGDEAVGRPG